MLYREENIKQCYKEESQYGTTPVRESFGSSKGEYLANTTLKRKKEMALSDFQTVAFVASKNTTKIAEIATTRNLRGRLHEPETRTSDLPYVKGTEEEQVMFYFPFCSINHSLIRRSIRSLTSRNLANLSSSDPIMAAGSSNDQCSL